MKYLHLVFLAVGGLSADLVCSENLPFPVSIPVRIQAGIASEGSWTKIPVEVRTLIDQQSGMEREYEPSEAGIYLDVAVRDPEEIPVFKDETTTKGSITKRTVEIPAQKGGEVALRITLEFGKDAPVESLAAIRACIAKIKKTSEQAVGPNGSLPPSPK